MSVFLFECFETFRVIKNETEARSSLVSRKCEIRKEPRYMNVLGRLKRRYTQKNKFEWNVVSQGALSSFLLRFSFPFPFNKFTVVNTLEFEGRMLGWRFYWHTGDIWAGCYQKSINMRLIFAFDTCDSFSFSASSLPLVKWKWLKQQTLAWGNKDVSRFILICGRIAKSQGQIRRRSPDCTCVSFVLMTWAWYCITHAKPQRVTWFQEGRGTVIILLLFALFCFLCVSGLPSAARGNISSDLSVRPFHNSSHVYCASFL